MEGGINMMRNLKLQNKVLSMPQKFYHISKYKIHRDINYTYSRTTADFGIGFYLYETEEDSWQEHFFCENQYLYEITIDMQHISIYKLFDIEDWLLLICYNQHLLSLTTLENSILKRLKKLLKVIYTYDMIYTYQFDFTTHSILETFIQNGYQCHDTYPSHLKKQYIVKSIQAYHKIHCRKIRKYNSKYTIYSSNIKKSCLKKYEIEICANIVYKCLEQANQRSFDIDQIIKILFTTEYGVNILYYYSKKEYFSGAYMLEGFLHNFEIKIYGVGYENEVLKFACVMWFQLIHVYHIPLHVIYEKIDISFLVDFKRKICNQHDEKYVEKICEQILMMIL